MIGASRLLARFAAALALAGISAPAQAGCWDGETIAAARLHEFHVRLSVAELRCGAGNDAFTHSINAYAARFGAQVTQAETRLREAVASLPGAERRSFENYTAALANRYGGDSSSPAFCGVLADLLADLNGEAATGDDLHTFALLLVREPMIEGRCPVTLLSARQDQ